MYCQGCLKQILQKLNDNDVIIVEKLYKENAIIPQCSLSWQTMLEKLKDYEGITPHNVYTSLKRLNEFGFVETQKWTRKNKYYVTTDGVNLLNLVDREVSE